MNDHPPNDGTILDLPIKALDLPPRPYWVLVQNERIRTIGELTTRSGLELMRCPNFGKVSLRDVRRALQRYNLWLRDEAPLEPPYDAPLPPPSPGAPLSQHLQAIEAKLDLILSKLTPS